MAVAENMTVADVDRSKAFDLLWYEEMQTWLVAFVQHQPADALKEHLADVVATMQELDDTHTANVVISVSEEIGGDEVGVRVESCNSAAACLAVGMVVMALKQAGYASDFGGCSNTWPGLGADVLEALQVKRQRELYELVGKER